VLRPIGDDADDLFEAGRDPAIWTYLPYGPYSDVAELRSALEEEAASDDPRFYAVEVEGRALGIVSYLRITPEHRVIEIGHIWFGTPLQRTAAATEAIYLLARHVFDDLGWRRLEWKTNAENAPSRRAAERFGFTFEGVFRKHQIVKGRNRDTAWFSIVDDEWPAIRAGFEAWLAPSNFDADGCQLRTLEECRR
jgi:RimJ/RimL family protein N-acetyltransferase